ncbi:2-hydroxyacid dehydrogenase family protein [Shouchella patagoniensis]|uniref:2-hydroxyacid dehydrogenase family protein n=1 Tax=Shouchella patagoniensis TaxID=228576 RepID=UPI000995D0B0|nr:2-hydroxyacid dehydrogenase family protein [Shouchella patagoniensis]
MPQIFISGEIPEVGYHQLQKYTFQVHTGESLITEDELKEGVAQAEALLCPLSTKVTASVLEAAPNLKIIANFGAGYDNIDVAAATAKGIVVTNTPNVSTEATAELALGLMIALMRRIPEGDTLCRTTGFNGWAPLFFLGRELAGKKLGIVGFGKIGQAVAKRASAFGMEILYSGRERKQEEEAKYGATYVSFADLAETADVISIHTAYNKETHHLFQKETFETMKRSAFLLNLARGPVVDEAALASALQEKQLAGAALDVFEFEPVINDVLKEMDNVVLTPHIGNATVETREAMARLSVENICRILEDGKAITPVN